MFDFLLRVKAMSKLRLSKPLRIMFLIVLLGALIAGIIYATVILNAVTKEGLHHVQHQRQY